MFLPMSYRRGQRVGHTKLSTKGQVILPKPVRDALNLVPGTEFAVEHDGETVVLRPLRPFPLTSVREVFGSAGYGGPTATLADMDAAVLAEAKRRK